MLTQGPEVPVWDLSAQRVVQVTSVAPDCSLEAAKAAERSARGLVRRALPRIVASGFSGPLSGPYDADTGSRGAWIGLIGSENRASYLSGT